MRLAELPFLVHRRLSNELRGYALRWGLTGAEKFDLSFLFTTMQGIYLYDRGRVRKLVDNQHFGITPLGDDAFASAEWVNKSPIERSRVNVYTFDGATITGRREISFKDPGGRPLQPYGIHQIRVLNGYLWVVNTRENVIWKSTLDGVVQEEWTETRKFPFDEGDPKPCIALRKTDADYRHYNSISYHQGHYFVLAHNCTQNSEKQDQRSYIIKLDEQLRTVERIEDVGEASHDLLFVDDSLYVCSSREGILLRNGIPLLQLDSFLRGASYSEGTLILGGSQFEVKSSARESTPSRLLFVDVDRGTLQETLTLGRVGNIRDILLWPGRVGTPSPAPIR